MSYQVIARKYRPQRFADVVGQEHVTQTLANAIVQSRIAHAYLFCGPRGTGKTTIARIFAKCLNCTGGPKVDFDDADERCREITEGRSIDVLEIDGASNNGVEQVRELRETVRYAPASSKFKIYIIDEVHMLTTAAFNALLKTLEEPPEHVKFMFATTDPEKVLPTILSRCQRFDLRRIPVALITQHLGQIATKEAVHIDPEALHAIARGADGGLRDAESALDQLISFCGTTIAEPDVLSMFGLTARSQVLALAQAVLEGQAETALRQLSELAKHGKDLGRLLSDLLGHFRNLLVYQVSGGDLKLIEVSEMEATNLQEQQALAPAETLTRVMEVLTEAEGRLRDAASKRIFLEVTLLKAIQARNATSLDEVLKQLHQLRSQEGAAGGAPPAAPTPAPAAAQRTADSRKSPVSSPATVSAVTAATPSAPALGPLPKPSEPAVPAPAGPTTTPAQDAAPKVLLTENDLVALWQEVLEAVGRASPFAKNYLIEAHPVSLAKDVLTIGFDPEFAEHIDLVNNQKTHSILQTKLAESGRPNTQVRFVKAERPAHWPGPQASPPVDQPAPAAVPAPASPTPHASTPAAAAAGPTPAGRPSPAPGPTSPAAKRANAPAPLTATDFKNDPLIQKALEIFKGRIVEIRA